jgi:hypothetical protein
MSVTTAAASPVARKSVAGYVDFTKERHKLYHTEDEIDAGILRIQATHPERYAATTDNRSEG